MKKQTALTTLESCPTEEHLLVRGWTGNDDEPNCLCEEVGENDHCLVSSCSYTWLWEGTGRETTDPAWMLLHHSHYSCQPTLTPHYPHHMSATHTQTPTPQTQHAHTHTCEPPHHTHTHNPALLAGLVKHDTRSADSRFKSNSICSNTNTLIYSSEGAGAAATANCEMAGDEMELMIMWLKMTSSSHIRWEGTCSTVKKHVWVRPNQFFQIFKRPSSVSSRLV